MRIEQLINDYTSGHIGINRVYRRLSFDERKEEYNQQRKNYRIKTKLADYVKTSAMSPEEIVLEREKAQATLALVDMIKECLGNDYEIFSLITIQGRTQEYVAKKLGISQSAVSRTYNHAIEHIQTYFKEIAETILYDDCRDLLLPQPSIKEIGGVKIKVRYPSEFLSKIYVGGRRGKRVWINHTRCVNDKYLDEAFGDTKTCCAYCEKCTNKKMRERIK